MLCRHGTSLLSSSVAVGSMCLLRRWSDADNLDYKSRDILEQPSVQNYTEESPWKY
jgi:hypothetical protein